MSLLGHVRLARNYLDENCFSPSFAWTVCLPGIIFTLWKQKWKGHINILLSTCKGILAVKGTCPSPEPHTAGRGKLCTHNLVQNPRPTRKHTGSCSEWLWMGIAVPHLASLLIIPQTCVKFSALFLLHFSASSLFCLHSGIVHSSLPALPPGQQQYAQPSGSTVYLADLRALWVQNPPSWNSLQMQEKDVLQYYFCTSRCRLKPFFL